jgi:hypothetical protein
MARESLITKVRNLLAQAEHPNTGDKEAQAFYAKAADLMERHALDAAVVRAEKGHKPEAIKCLTFTVSGQGYHGKARASLVDKVAKGYGCEVVWQGNTLNSADRYALIVGTASACKALELLLPSIIAQAEMGAFAATRKHMEGKEFDTPANKNIARRDYFRSYLAGYGKAVGNKIGAGRRTLRKEVADTPGALVLVTDADRITQEFNRLFPETGTVRASKTDAAGYAQGERDGRNADTGDSKVTGKTKTAIEASK